MENGGYGMGSASLVPPRIRANPWVVLTVLTLGAFMITLDTSIVYVALPKIETGLNANFDQILWVVNGYMLTYAVLLITAGRLGDLFGPKHLFIGGLIVFTLASLACGLSQSAGELIVFRVIQAVGGAMLTPQSLSAITSLFPPERRGAAFGVWGISAGLAVAMGPIIGGFLVTSFDWQAIFFLNVPIGLFAVCAAYLLMPTIKTRVHHDLDVKGLILVSCGLFMGVFALIEGQTYSWGPLVSAGNFWIGSSHWGVLSIYSLLAFSGIVLAIFVFEERRAVEPLIPFELLRERNFSIANLVSLNTSFALTSMWIPVILLLQSIMGWSALHAGVTVIPYSVGVMVMAPLAGRLSDRVGAKYILLFGFTLSTIGILLLAMDLSLIMTSWTLAVPLAIGGAAMGCTMVPLTTVAMRNVKPEMAGAASGFINTVRQVGGVIGTAIIGAVLANQVVAQLPSQATKAARSLPIATRQRFIASLLHMSKATERFGAGQRPRIPLAPGTPAAVAARIVTAAQDAFAYAFLDGARTCLVVVAIVMALGIPSVMLLQRRRRVSPAARVPRSDQPVPVASLSGR